MRKEKKVMKKERKVRKARKAPKVNIPEMPEPLRRRVMREKIEKPEDVRVIRPANRTDPVVMVKDKVVGAWIDL